MNAASSRDLDTMTPVGKKIAGGCHFKRDLKTERFGI